MAGHFARQSTLAGVDGRHQAEAILNINRASFVTSAHRVSAERLLHIRPESARLLHVSF